MATGIQTTETLRTTEKTEFFKLFSVPSAVLSVSVVKIDRWLSTFFNLTSSGD
jgi:hypothetical protein